MYYIEHAAEKSNRRPNL